MKKLLSFAILALATFLTGCASSTTWDIGADSKQRSEVLGMGAVHQGVIVQARSVRIEPNNQYVSASLGGLIGAALGNRVSSNSGRGVATAVGSVFGAVVGNAVGGSMGGVAAQELLVRLENGTLISVTQAESRLSPGQPVFLVQSGGKIRVTPKV